MWAVVEDKTRGIKFDVYSTDDIIRTSCEMVNGYGCNPDDIEVTVMKPDAVEA